MYLFSAFMLDFLKMKRQQHQVWWHTSVILALGRLTQKDGKLEARLGYIARP
jgi:hypothetical protein